MSSVAIAGTTYNAYSGGSGVPNSSPAAGAYYPLPDMPGGPPSFGDPEIREVQHDWASINGVGTTRFKDFGKVKIPIQLVFVDTTKNAAVGRYNTALTAFAANARYAIVVNNVTFKGKLVKGSAHHIASEFKGGMFHETYGFIFEHLGG